MAPRLRHIVSVVTLLCIISLAFGYVPLHERPGRIHDRARPVDTLDERPSLLTRLPGRLLPGPVPRSTSTANMPFLAVSGINRRLAAVEAHSTATDRSYDKLAGKVSGMEGRIQHLQTMMRETNSPQPEPLSELRSANLDLETRVSRLETDNEDLRQFLVAFEQFFHRLRSANPAAYDPNAAPAQRLSRLHQYLGNAEAELIDVSRQTLMTSSADGHDGDDSMEHDHPDDHPATRETEQVVDQWETVDIFVTGNKNNTTSRDMNIQGKGTSSRVAPKPGQHGQGMTMSISSSPSRVTPERESGVHLSNLEADRLAVAMEQLEAQNQQLTTRLQSLERQAAESGPVGGGQTFGISSSNVNTNAITEELLNKVEILEQVVALQASSILDDTPTPDRNGPSGPYGRGFSISTAQGTSGGGAATGKGSSTSMKQEDVTIMKDVLQDARTSGSSSRKSAFSVARTTPLVGTDDHQQVEFDHVFVNKGRDFVTRNSTFICERAGYYFITFHLRSYDGLYLGVSLMKNDDIVTAIFTDAHERNVMEGQSVVLHLETGDNLYLLLGPSPEFGLHSNHRKYVTFSGFMIYAGY